MIANYNQDPAWHGILVQLPLPKHIDEEAVLLAIDPEKDVDGFHPLNMGRLWSGHPVMIPSTPAGIMEMFHEYGIDLEVKMRSSLVVQILLGSLWRSYCWLKMQL